MIDIAATCFGVNVPLSPYLTETRIERINKGRYEGQEIAGALALVQEGDNVLELGAGLGIVGAVIAKNRAPHRVVSFEANPHLIPHIETLYAQNGLQGIIEVRNEVLVAAPDAPATMDFQIRKSFLGSSLGQDDARTIETVKIPTRAYAEVAEEVQPDVLVMDIEGGELGLLEYLDLRAVRAMVIEFHPKAYGIEGMRRCKNVLRKAGLAPMAETSTRTVWAAYRQK